MSVEIPKLVNIFSSCHIVCSVHSWSLCVCFHCVGEFQCWGYECAFPGSSRFPPEESEKVPSVILPPVHSTLRWVCLFYFPMTSLFCFLLLMCCFGTLCMSGQQVTSLKEIWPCSRTIYYLEMANLHACLFVKKSLCMHETLMSGVVNLT